MLDVGLRFIKLDTSNFKIWDIMPIADRTLLVDKRKYKMHILPFGKEMAR